MHGLILLLVILAAPTLAEPLEGAGGATAERLLEDPAPWDFAPFAARYRVRYEGVPFGARAVRSLQREGDRLHFRSEIRAPLLRVDEQSTLLVVEGEDPRAAFYVTRQKGLGRNRERRVDFRWDEDQLVRTGDKPRVDPLEPGLLDPLGWQLLLRRDLATGPSSPGTVLRYRITDGGDPEDVVLEVVGPAQVKVPEGVVDATLLERRYEEEDDEESMRLWADPLRDWILVRLEHVKDGRGLSVSLEKVLE